MENHQSASAHTGDHPENVELFCLELDHQIQSAIRPAIKAELDHRQKVFDATINCLAEPAPKRSEGRANKRKRGSHSNRARRNKRKKRRRQKSKPPFVRDLAARLARRWKAPLIVDARLKPAG